MSNIVEIDISILRDSLIECFIDYYFRQDYPVKSQTETYAIKLLRYREDNLFRVKVDSRVDAILHLVYSSTKERKS